MGGEIEDEIAELLSEMVLQFRKKGSVDEKLLERLSGMISDSNQWMNQLLAEHLRGIVRAMRDGSFEERSLLGKSVRMDEQELRMIAESIDRFLEEDPFREMETKEVLLLWRKSLELILKGLSEDEEISS